jgi:uncharacterized protein YecE (DUF72 family)
MLRDARVAADPARLPDAGRPGPGGSRALEYYRLHGAPRMEYSKYEPSFLALANAIARSTATEVWCIFDNTASWSSNSKRA